MRQFFRIVTSEVSFWYKDHSTSNPLGVLPDPATTQIVVGDKFSDEGVEIINDASVQNSGPRSLVKSNNRFFFQDEVPF